MAGGKPGKPIRRERHATGRRRSVHVRLSNWEYLLLHDRAAAAGVSPPKFLVDAALARPVRVVERRAVNDALLDVRRTLIGIGTNVNQLAKVANTTGQLLAGSDEALASVAAMQAAVADALAAVTERLRFGS